MRSGLSFTLFHLNSSFPLETLLRNTIAKEENQTTKPLPHITETSDNEGEEIDGDLDVEERNPWGLDGEGFTMYKEGQEGSDKHQRRPVIRWVQCGQCYIISINAISLITTFIPW